MTNNHETSLAVDSAVAGGIMTMPLWAVNLNEWLHFVMTIVGFFIIMYRLFVLIRDVKNKNKPVE
jgi:large-conductance mechanosensitive channel